MESRYWACFIIKTALNAKTDQLAAEIGLERAFLTTEYRFFTRDITRFSMVASESQCQRKWGSKVGYLGAGVYGLAYIRCIDADGHCPDGARAVIKMAGLPPWDRTRETFKLDDPKLRSLPPWGGQYGLELSEKSLALGKRPAAAAAVASSSPSIFIAVLPMRRGPPKTTYLTQSTSRTCHHRRVCGENMINIVTMK